MLYNASFNNNVLFGTTGSLSFQVGAGTSANDMVDIPQKALTGGKAGTSGGVTGADTPADVMATVIGSSDIAASQAAAVNAMKDIDVAIDKINAEHATYGVALNRFDATISGLSIANENTQGVMTLLEG